MTKLLLLTALAAILVSGQSPKISDEFIGVWNLISFERRTAAGEVTYPMGAKPVGRLTYDALGRMSAQIMRPDRPKFQSASSGRGPSRSAADSRRGTATAAGPGGSVTPASFTAGTRRPSPRFSTSCARHACRVAANGPWNTPNTCRSA